MTVYLSGPISGLDHNTCFQKFESVERMLVSAGLKVVNPMKLDHSHDGTWESYMRQDIAELMKCDAIYLLSGWEQSRGAKIEIKLAKELNFQIFI